MEKASGEIEARDNLLKSLEGQKRERRGTKFMRFASLVKHCGPISTLRSSRPI
jgi:hypothetical protein